MNGTNLPELMREYIPSVRRNVRRPRKNWGTDTLEEGTIPDGVYPVAIDEYDVVDLRSKSHYPF